jgi:hypothetical protein
MPLPELNPKRARAVLARIDEILAWRAGVEGERDARFVQLGKYLCEVRAGQYWRVEKLASFDEFLEKRFPGSRRKAYYFMAIHEQLPRQVRPQLAELGWSKAAELAKVARAEGPQFDCATWLHRAKELPKEQFKQEVQKQLTGASEAYDLVYFKIFKSQLRVIEQALELAGRMLGSDKSRSYCLEMICADFLAGAQLEGANAEQTVASMLRLFRCFAIDTQQLFLTRLRDVA